jgi:hypothetical protein
MATLFQPCTYGMCLCSSFTSSKVNKILQTEQAIIQIVNAAYQYPKLKVGKYAYTRLATKDLTHPDTSRSLLSSVWIKKYTTKD